MKHSFETFEINEYTLRQNAFWDLNRIIYDSVTKTLSNTSIHASEAMRVSWNSSKFQVTLGIRQDNWVKDHEKVKLSP